MRFNWTKETTDQLLRWRTEGLSQMEMAERLGISKNAVNCKLIRLRKAGLLPAKLMGGKNQQARTGEVKPVGSEKLLGTTTQADGTEAVFGKLVNAVCVLVNLTGKLVERYDKGYPNE